MLKLEHISKTYPAWWRSTTYLSNSSRAKFTPCSERTERANLTLIKIIAGAIEPDAGGIIDFDGKKFTHMTLRSPHRTELQSSTRT